MATIKNYLNSQELAVRIMKYPDSGSFVCITQHSGSMHFQIDITENEARYFAHALLKLADELAKEKE